MRRLAKNERALHESLLSLPPKRRLFVQRRIELFDHRAIYGVRVRLVSYNHIASELAEHKRKDLHISLLKVDQTTMLQARLEDASLWN